MQVSVEKTSELNRRMTVSLPEEMVQEKMENRFKSLAKTVKVHGFRPGKVPVRVVKQMYSQQVKGEIMGDLIQSSYVEALQSQQLNPAGMPQIDMIKESDGFEYIAEFEIYPEVSLERISDLEIKKPVATVQQQDQDTIISKLREQKLSWHSTDDAAETGDKITCHLQGSCEGEVFTGDQAIEDYEVIIGSEQMIPGFEDELIGLKAGDKKTFDITFPEEYGNKKIAGKPTTFDIEVIKVEHSQLPDIDEDFIKGYGVEDGTMESFLADVRNNLEKQLDLALKNALKQSILDGLYEKIVLPLPKALIDQEIDSMQKAYQANAQRQGSMLQDSDLLVKDFEEEAKKRIALSLIMGKIIQENDLTVDDAMVRAKIEELAESYDDPEEIINWHYADQERLNQIKQLELENIAVNWVVSQAQVSEQPVTFDEIINQQ